MKRGTPLEEFLRDMQEAQKEEVESAFQKVKYITIGLVGFITGILATILVLEAFWHI